MTWDMAIGKVDMVKLQSSNGDIFEVSLKVAKVSRTLATMLDGQEIDGDSFLCSVCDLIIWSRVDQALKFIET